MHAVNICGHLYFTFHEASKGHEINYNKGECRCLQLGSYSRLTDESPYNISDNQLHGMELF